MRGFYVIPSPLTKLLRKGIKFEWTDKCQNSFEQLKGMLVVWDAYYIKDGKVVAYVSR